MAALREELTQRRVKWCDPRHFWGIVDSPNDHPHAAKSHNRIERMSALVTALREGIGAPSIWPIELLSIGHLMGLIRWQFTVLLGAWSQFGFASLENT